MRTSLGCLCSWMGVCVKKDLDRLRDLCLIGGPSTMYKDDVVILVLV
jgi:hypothetical protein